ncbi:DUF302 domain-containing protein [Anaerobacillus sp. CMMVII]|uniref:DUF302 domain-containing protein n=1 Tax=Anaerobacillus sp. CMMVII TaxID=2755588 RepID=UPI0021B77E9E|nr:DUF302 domain-containing protein [Anaerobacillus sp. CMMVII]MCT8139317.1 DUF302 domain-containing protein [Anaerobacillus sp. CMMVII]
MFHYTVETTNSINETIKSLEKNLAEEQFGILWKFDVKAKLLEKGLNFEDEYQVLEVCNPVEAERVLSQNKMIGYFLPCKIVVFADKGKTMLGMPKPSFLINSVTEDDKDLLEMAKDIEKRLIDCINKSM